MIRLLSLVATVLTIAATAHGQEKPVDIDLSRLGTKYRLLGKLHEPLGMVVTVQGVVANGPYKGSECGPNVYVQRINGRSTQEHIRILLEPYFQHKVGETNFEGKSLPKLKLGDTYEFEGYESGDFVGVPRNAYDRAGIMWATSGHYFRHQLVVYAGKKIVPIRWSPADFVDREALIEGKAVSDNKMAFIVGKDWRLLTDANSPWPKDHEGKTVEGFGVVRKTDKPDVQRLEKGTTRLVKLEDQLGKKVMLRGTAWSMNGHWWFNYRGTDLYVENMKDLPKWNGDLHSESVQIEGELDEAMLPYIRQLTVKENPDKIKYFIVRKPTWKPIDNLLSPERDPR